MFFVFFGNVFFENSVGYSEELVGLLNYFGSVESESVCDDFVLSVVGRVEIGNEVIEVIGWFFFKCYKDDSGCFDYYVEIYNEKIDGWGDVFVFYCEESVFVYVGFVIC